jgi:hypothetical protein
MEMLLPPLVRRQHALRRRDPEESLLQEVRFAEVDGGPDLVAEVPLTVIHDGRQRERYEELEHLLEPPAASAAQYNAVANTGSSLRPAGNPRHHSA